LSGSTEAGTRVIATNLAREGIDVVRNIRDTNWLQGAPWDRYLYSGAADFTAIAVFNPTTRAWQLKFDPSVIDDAAAKLYLEDNNLYLQDVSSPGGTGTSYARLLTLDPICLTATTPKVETITGSACGGGEEKIGVRVKSEVAWTESGRSHIVTLEDKLYNWR
jgi:hypothetical protein